MRHRGVLSGLLMLSSWLLLYSDYAHSLSINDPASLLQLSMWPSKDYFLRQKRQKPEQIKKESSRKESVTDAPTGRHTSEPEQVDDSGARCLMKCLHPMIQKAPQDTSNQTLICPHYDQERTEELCNGYLAVRQCLESCPDTVLKNLSTSGFKPLQFMCVDRIDDFRNYMPCLSSSCDEVQKQCEPTCGSLDDTVKKLARIQQQVHGPGSPTRGADLDRPQIIKILGDNCRLVDCIGNCTQGPITQKCGTDAYNLQRDSIWTMLSSMAKALSSIGLNNVWPAECQSLVRAEALRQQYNTVRVGTDHAPKSNASVNTDRAPNSSDRFLQKNRDQLSTTQPISNGVLDQERLAHTNPTGSAPSIFVSLSSTVFFAMAFVKVVSWMNVIY